MQPEVGSAGALDLDRAELTVVRGQDDTHRPATDEAVLDVVLLIGREIELQRHLFPATRTNDLVFE